MSRAPALAGICALFGCVWQFGDPPPEPDRVTVAPQGGVVAFPGGPTLRVPAGAVSAGMQISIVQSGAVPPARASTAVYEFKPGETVFAVPATVSFPLPAGTREAVILWSAGANGHYEPLQTVVEAGVAEAQIAQLGTGYVAIPVGPTRTVSGALSTVFWRDDGTKTSREGAVYPPMAVKAILVPNGSGYDRLAVPGSGASFSVPGVPEGRYFLQVDTTYPPTSSSAEAIFTQLIELTTSQPDLSTVLSGRPDLEIAIEGGSPVTLDVANLFPWTPASNGVLADAILLASAQGHAFVRPSGAQRITAGSTSARLSFDWWTLSSGIRAGLPDASKGDVAYLYQRSTRPIGAGATAGVARVASRFQRLDGLTVRSGTPTAIQASLADAPQTGSIHVDLRNAQFAALLPQVNALATPDFQAGGVSVLAVPHSVDFPDMPDDATSSLLWVQGPATTNVDYGDVSYGQFLGPSWRESRYIVYLIDVNLPVPGNTATYPASAALISLVPAPDTTPVAPALGPPRSVQINGKDASVAQSSVGLSPLISWSPPALGTATSYVARIELVNLGPATPGLQQLWISVYSGTSVQVPAGFLQSGRQYVLTVAANSAPWDALDRPPFRTGTPFHTADCVSAIFTP